MKECGGSSEVGQGLWAEEFFRGYREFLQEVWPLAGMGGVGFERALMFCALGAWSMVEWAEEAWLLRDFVGGFGGSSPGEVVMGQWSREEAAGVRRCGRCSPAKVQGRWA